MPSIPRYDSPTVAPQGVPVPQAQGVSPAAFGAGFGEAIQQSAQGLDAIAKKQQEDMDAARITAAIPQLDDAEHQVVTAARSKQGWDTLPVHDQAVGDFDKSTGLIIDGLANDRQKQIVRRMAAQQRGSISTQLDSYTNAEVRKAQAQDVQTAAVSTANLAVSHYQDPARLSQDLARGEAVITSYGKRAGLSPETVTAQVASWKSGVHVGVVERAIQDRQIDFAKSYLDANKDAIDGDQLGRLEKAVHEGDVLGQAFTETDRIMASTNDLASAQKQVRDIKDPDVRQRAQAEVDQRFQEQEAAHRIGENHLFEGWSAQLERNGDHSINHLRAQMGADWFKLDTSSRVSLENRAKQMELEAQGVPAKTDERVWTAFWLATPDQQQQVNPLKDLLPYSSESDYQQMVQHIAQLRQGGTGSTAGVTDSKDQLLQAAQGAGIVPRDPVAKWDDNQVARYAGMQRAMNLEIQSFKDKNNRNPTPTESQDIVYGLMTQQLRSTGAVRWYLPGVTYDESNPKNRRVLSSVTDADVAHLTASQLEQVNVPPEAVAQYTNRLRSYGKVASRTDIVRLWLAALRNDPAVGQELFQR